MKEIQDYIERNKARFMDEYFQLLRIPSVSSQSQHAPDMLACTDLLRQLFLAAGADRVEVLPTAGHPVFYAEKHVSPELPTVLVYGHYDVQPPEPFELWETPPFEPSERGGRAYARGANDNKGQFFAHLKALELMSALGGPPCNIKFMIEGEEEVGSPNLRAFCEQNQELLKADALLISDTSMIDPTTPSLTTGMRGLCYWQVELTGPSRDLHSGLYGGAVANPLVALAQMVAQLHDAEGRVTIPGFYDKVRQFSDQERAALAAGPFDQDEFNRSIGIPEAVGEEGFSTRERVGIRPCLDLCGIWGGYTGQGAKTVLPSKAYAKISTRLVPDQDHHEVAVLFQRYFEGLAPKGVSVKVEYLHGGNPFISKADSPAYRAAEQAVWDAFGSPSIPVYSGGSIPILSVFEEVLGLNAVLMGIGLDSDAIHSPNESFRVDQLLNGIAAATRFHQHFVGLQA